MDKERKEKERKIKRRKRKRRQTVLILMTIIKEKI